jgi:Kef-type K+ transport system membrane component KefB
MFDNALFLLQIAVIVGFSRVVALLFARFRQPQVVGEMAAGIALGPSLFGLVAPGAYHALFAPDSLGFLNALSQVGLIVFMFLIGVRVDFSEMRRQSGVALVTSNISVIVPLGMGVLLAQYLFPRYGNGGHVAFALFIGTAMSVTAFPVLARILMERNLLGTRLGSVAIACAAVDDITAWILLATIVALVNQDQNARPLWMMFVYLLVYIGFMVVLGRVLHAWSRRIDERKPPLEAVLAFIVLALLSGAAGEWIGIHALVGAFIAGLVTPRQFRPQLIDKLETVTLLLLIPLFFALTGIRTNLVFRGAGAGVYIDLLLILFVAVICKWGGTMLGARAKGMSWQDASHLGLLMNTRGLVGLIVLNVGLDSGILSPTLFSMMVCMALVTTFMATPLIDRFSGKPLKAVAA